MCVNNSLMAKNITLELHIFCMLDKGRYNPIVWIIGLHGIYIIPNF